MPSAQLAAISSQAEAQAARLLDDVKGLLEVASGDNDAATLNLARSILHLRDTLEGVAFLLEEAGGGKVLRAALRAIDEEAEASLSAFPETECFDGDERLAAVYASDPLAWWGQFGSG